MNKTTRRATTALGIAAAMLTASTAFAQSSVPANQDFGMGGDKDMYTRVVEVGSGGKITVMRGEVVKIAGVGNGFVWNFDTVVPSFPLSKIAPGGAGGSTMVYVIGQDSQKD
jgi:hypothetical protein